jgi:WD40 repeat protein
VQEVGSDQALLTAPGDFAVFSPEGTRLLDVTGQVWEVASGRVLFTVPDEDNANIAAAVFSLDAKVLATVDNDSTVTVRDGTSGQELFSVAGSNIVALSPDGTKLATIPESRTPHVWDVTTGKDLYALATHRDDVTRIFFSPDGKFVTTASYDKTVKVSDAATGGLKYTLTGHTAVVWDVAADRDGKYLATASADRTVKLWDPTTGRELLTLFGQMQGVGKVVLSPDGTRLVSRAFDGTARLYVLPVDELVALAHSRVTRPLTQEECDLYHIAPCPTEP